MSLARAARSERPWCSSRRIPRRQRCGVQFPPSGKMTSAPFWSSPRASRSISLVKMLSPVWRLLIHTFGTRLPTMSTLGSSCSEAFITTRGRRW